MCRKTVRTNGLGIALAVLVIAAGCTQTSNTPAADTATKAGGAVMTPSVVTNAVNCHLLDFVAWNNRDMDMFRRLHTVDVKVNMGAIKTDGIEAHVAGIQPTLQAMPDARVVQHSPIVAEGEWTCMVGIIVPVNMKMVTVAKWRDGAISEEYILTNLLKPGAAKPAVSGSPMVSISNQDAALKREIGAEPGGSCVLDRTADGQMVIVLSKKGGAAADEMVFTQ